MRISKLILGTVQMGLPYGINNSNGQTSLIDSLEILKVAYDYGLRYLDTAEAYGTSHHVIGKFHEKFPDNKFEVITKFPHVITDGVEANLKRYLKDLKVDYLSGLLFHSYQSYQDNKKHFMPLLAEFKKTGLVRSLGVSVYTNEEIEEVINDENIDIVQFPYNALDNRNLRGEVLYKAKKRGKLVHTRSCFLQGLFFSPLDSNNKIVNMLNNELSEIHEISRTTQISIKRMALNYCIQDDLIDNVLIGVDNVQQLIENLEDSTSEVADEMFHKINKVHVKNLNLLNPSLWSSL
jgi:aryl-alcohol dehydrogenase-like predicted oxidoreductase